MLLASAATFAQNSVGQFTFTPKVGLNIADFQKCEGSDARFGLIVGVEFHLEIDVIVCRLLFLLRFCSLGFLRFGSLGRSLVCCRDILIVQILIL